MSHNTHKILFGSSKIAIIFLFLQRLTKYKSMRIGFGYDVHVLAEGLPFVIGGVKIDSPFGCVAHSDGDVAIHALCDALLGAIAAGDIGKHFPDNDMAYKGIDSCILLERTVEVLRREGYRIGNVDITIALERPKLRPHIDSMRARLAEVMGVEIGVVSIKATTTEKLGFTGRGEGVAAYAVALVEQL
jgi:2-C-methyl-D-erythritol 2,4-cyclodiphosphate synthase